jgi:hypothetical protein
MIDFVDHARDTAEELLDRAEAFVEHAVQTFDPTHQVERHPWLMVGGALLAGYAVGLLENRQGSDRPISSHRADSGSPPTKTSVQANTATTNVWDAIVGQAQGEIELAKGAVVEVGRTFIRELFQQVLPALIEPTPERRQPSRRPSASTSRRSGPDFPRDMR